MFERLPREREVLSWSYVLLWSGLTFVSVPFVRSATELVRGQWGSEAFTYAVAIIVVSATAATLLLIRGRWSLASCGSLLAVGVLVVYLTLGLGDGSPEEAVHYVQYGFLSLLLYRAFSHRVRDYSIYAAATIAGTFVGMVDETVQWLTPGRFFDLRDIWLNLAAIALVQVGLAAGVRPTIITGWPGWAGVRRLCHLAALAVGYLGLCHLNTPERIAWYSAHVPVLGFIDANRSIMVEYGYLHGNADTGTFRSRLTAEELRRLSRDRAEEGARVLDRYRRRDHYPMFLELYSPRSDPFLHEARVHLFRRDIHLERAMESEESEEQGRHFATAFWENRILRGYFGDLLGASSYDWSAPLEAYVRDRADTAEPYDSWVSGHLIVAFSPQQGVFLFSTAVGSLLLLGAYAGRRSAARFGGDVQPARDFGR